MNKIEDCKNCGACMTRCPYGLNTPALLRRNLEDYRTFLKYRTAKKNPSREGFFLLYRINREGFLTAVLSFIVHKQSFCFSAFFQLVFAVFVYDKGEFLIGVF